MKFNNDAEAVICLVEKIYKERIRKDRVGDIIYLEVFFSKDFYSVQLSKADKTIDLEFVDPTIVSLYFRDRTSYMGRLKPSSSDNIIRMKEEDATSLDVLDYCAVNSTIQNNDEPKISLSYVIPDSKKLSVTQRYNGKYRVLYVDLE